MVLILLEALVVPGFGIAGLSGISLTMYGLYLLLLPDVPVSQEILGQAMDGFLIGLVGAIIGLYLLARIMIKTKFWEKLTSPDSQKKEDGYSNTLGWEYLKGEKGVADTDLHPSGWARLNDERIFVVSEGEFIDKGKDIIILSVDGNRVLVREIKK